VSSETSQRASAPEAQRTTTTYPIQGGQSTRFKVVSENDSGQHYHAEELKHVTARGEKVRSKSELVIANQLAARGIPYGYEVALSIDGSTIYPDFTIERETGERYFWEHAGMLADANYRERWDQKRHWYTQHGIYPADEGGGPNGTLIATYDGPKDGVSSTQIDYLIQTVLLR